MLFFGWSHGAHESGEMSSALIFCIKYECTCIDTSLAVQVPYKRIEKLFFNSFLTFFPLTVAGSDWPMCHCAMAHGPLLGHQMGGPLTIVV